MRSVLNYETSQVTSYQLVGHMLDPKSHSTRQSVPVVLLKNEGIFSTRISTDWRPHRENKIQEIPYGRGGLEH